MQELHATVRERIKPIIELFRIQDQHHAFFIGELVELPHERMFIGIDGQHTEAAQDLSRGRLQFHPDTCQTHQVTIGTANAGGHHPTRAPVLFVERLDWNDAVPAHAPSVPVAGLFRHGLGAGVVGASGNARHRRRSHKGAVRQVGASLPRQLKSCTCLQGTWAKMSHCRTIYLDGRHLDGSKCKCNQ